jgi:hypothetical protein
MATFAPVAKSISKLSAVPISSASEVCSAVANCPSAVRNVAISVSGSLHLLV